MSPGKRFIYSRPRINLNIELCVTNHKASESPTGNPRVTMRIGTRQDEIASGQSPSCLRNDSPWQGVHTFLLPHTNPDVIAAPSNLHHEKHRNTKRTTLMATSFRSEMLSGI